MTVDRFGLWVEGVTHAKMLEQDVNIDFARSSSGDGFYIWNRDDGLEASVNLYHFMHIVLADNAIARSRSSTSTVKGISSGSTITISCSCRA